MMYSDFQISQVLQNVSMQAPMAITYVSKGKIPLHLKQNIVHKWVYGEERCSKFYIGESSRCLPNRVNLHSSHVTSAIYMHIESNNHSNANISNLNVDDEDSRQVAKQARTHPHQDQQSSTQSQHRKHVHSRNLQQPSRSRQAF